MTSEDLVQMALAMPGAEESAHFGKRDFRVGGRIFLALPEPGRAVIKLTRGQQAMLTETEPGLCAAVPGPDDQNIVVHAASLNCRLANRA